MVPGADTAIVLTATEPNVGYRLDYRPVQTVSYVKKDSITGDGGEGRFEIPDILLLIIPVIIGLLRRKYMTMLFVKPVRKPFSCRDHPKDIWLAVVKSLNIVRANGEIRFMWIRRNGM